MEKIYPAQTYVFFDTVKMSDRLSSSEKMLLDFWNGSHATSSSMVRWLHPCNSLGLFKQIKQYLKKLFSINFNSIIYPSLPFPAMIPLLVNFFRSQLFKSMYSRHKINKTGLQPVSKPVEQILGIFQKGFFFKKKVQKCAKK